MAFFSDTRDGIRRSPGSEEDSAGSGSVSFGVVIPAFRSAETIRSTLDAVAAQTYPAAAVVVVVDGPDQTLEAIVASHPSKPDRITLAENAGGPATPRNVGGMRMRRRGDIDAIWFLDDDDFPSASFLSVMNDVLSDHPESAGVSSGFRNWFDGSARSPNDPRPLERPGTTRIDLDWYLENTCALLPSFAVFRVEALDLLDRQGGGFNHDLTNNQDYEVFARLLHLADCRRVDWCGGDYRIRPLSISADTVRAWSCREHADQMLGDWFDSKSLGRIGRDFRKRYRSAGRRAARERWHGGRRLAAVTDLLRRGLLGFDFKAFAVTTRLVFGLDRRPERGGG